MKITLSMKVDDVIELFEHEFSVILKINKVFDSDTSLLEISNAKSKNIFLNITKDTKISALENMFENHFGIPVTIRDSSMHSINTDLRLGDIKELSVLKIKTDNSTPDRANPDKKDSIQKNSKPIKLDDNTDFAEKNSYTTSIKNNDHIEDLISKIDKSYMAFQEKEKYEYMLNLLTVIEDTSLTYPDNSKLNKHIIDIKTKAYSISNIVLKKSKFTLIIFSIITSIILIFGLFMLAFDIYNHVRSLKKIDNISREITNLNNSKRKALENKNNEEAIAIDKMIEDNNKAATEIEKKLNKNKANIFLPLSLVGIIIIAIAITKIERYYITSTRFYK